MISADLGAKLGVTFPNSAFQRPVPAEGNYWVPSLLPLSVVLDSFKIKFAVAAGSGHRLRQLLDCLVLRVLLRKQFS